MKIAPEYQKYFCFEWGGEYFKFTRYIWGINTAVSDFIALMIAMMKIAEISEIGIVNQGNTANQVDDFLITDLDENKCREKTRKFVELANRIGFTLNVTKSELEPKKKIQFCGKIFDTENNRMNSTTSSEEKTVELLNRLSERNTVKVEEIQKLGGLWSWVVQDNMKGRWILKEIYRPILGMNFLDSNITIPLSNKFRENMKQWAKDIALYSFQKLSNIHMPTTYTYADANVNQIGIINEKLRQNISEKIPDELLDLPIQYKELYALERAIVHTPSSFNGKTVQYFVDNSNVFSWITKGMIQESPKRTEKENLIIRKGNEIFKRIGNNITKRNITIFIQLVKSEDNLADAPSRAKIQSEIKEISAGKTVAEKTLKVSNKDSKQGFLKKSVTSTEDLGDIKSLNSLIQLLVAKVTKLEENSRAA
jgi:hypothetical protein